MPSELTQDFETSCRGQLGGIFGAYGFAFEGAYVQPRCVVAAFARRDDRCLVIDEGGAIICDLIRRVTPGPYYRISINELLWFHGVRSLPRCRGREDQLAVLAAQLPAHAGSVFSRQAPALDSRYCFPMSEEQCREYLGNP